MNSTKVVLKTSLILSKSFTLNTFIIIESENIRNSFRTGLSQIEITTQKKGAVFLFYQIYFFDSDEFLSIFVLKERRCLWSVVTTESFRNSISTN